MMFGEMLKSLRKAAGKTQDQLAADSGVPVGTIREYEQAKREPLLRTALRLATGLGVSIEAFAGCLGEDRPTKPPAEAPKAPAKKRPRKRD